MVTNVGGGSATSGGININNPSEVSILSKGVCWGTSIDPVVGIGNYTEDGSGEDPYISYIYGLSASTTYYVRAYVTTAYGTYYGGGISITTHTDYVDVYLNPISHLGEILVYCYDKNDGTGSLINVNTDIDVDVLYDEVDGYDNQNVNIHILNGNNHGLASVGIYTENHSIDDANPWTYENYRYHPY